jgi:pyruvate dehydrogenase E2 component (dihydrolipoamide acetyltransferase)
MATAIVMPQVGQDIKTGVIVEWCVKEGDRIEKGDAVAVVESDKATFELEAYESGILLKIVHAAGAEVPVLAPIAYLGEPGEEIEHLGDAEVAGEEAIQETPSQRPELASEHAERQRGTKVAVSPSARRLAEQHGIDTDKLTGTGPKGRVTKDDVLAAIEAKDGPIDANASS